MCSENSVTGKVLLPCECAATPCDDGSFRIEVGDWSIGCPKRHRAGDTMRRMYTLTQTVSERHYYDPETLCREFGTPTDGESFEDFVIRVFERFDGSIYGDEFFPTDANPQVGVDLVAGWDDD